MSELSPPTRFFKLDTRDTTSVSTTYYAAYQDYENGKGGKAILFVTNRDFDTGIVKAKVMFLIDLQKGQGVREYVQERIADVASCEELSARPEYQEVDPGNYAGDFAFLGQMLEIQ
ncbi:MAG: hypothetical protein JNM83_13475 [Myxococcales bacterium]|jgi:hypothetical protein|nr:hypothetical protein [Myxococcales bacterium]